MRPAEISSHFCGNHNQPFSRESWNVSICDCGDQNSYFKPNHVVFLTLAKWFLCLNLPRLQLYDDGPAHLSLVHCNTCVFLETVIYVVLGATGHRPIRFIKIWGCVGISDLSLQAVLVSECPLWLNSGFLVTDDRWLGSTLPVCDITDTLPMYLLQNIYGSSMTVTVGHDV